MGEEEEFTCKQCGSHRKLRSYDGYCFKCYNEIWDGGFQSTSEHAYQIGHSELNEKLDGPINDGFKETILEIKADFDTETWECTKCHQARPDDLLDTLLAPCPYCGAEGYLKHHVKGRYFH